MNVASIWNPAQSAQSSTLRGAGSLLNVITGPLALAAVASTPASETIAARKTAAEAAIVLERELGLFIVLLLLSPSV